MQACVEGVRKEAKLQVRAKAPGKPIGLVSPQSLEHMMPPLFHDMYDPRIASYLRFIDW